jgi:hypothetical protein
MSEYMFYIVWYMLYIQLLLCYDCCIPVCLSYFCSMGQIYNNLLFIYLLIHLFSHHHTTFHRMDAWCLLSDDTNVNYYYTFGAGLFTTFSDLICTKLFN